MAQSLLTHGLTIFLAVYFCQVRQSLEINVTECDLDWSCSWYRDPSFDLIANCFYQTQKISNSSFNFSPDDASLTIFCYEQSAPPTMLECMVMFAGIARIRKLHIYSCNHLKIYDGDLDPFNLLEEFNTSHSDLDVLEDHVFYSTQQLRTIHLVQRYPSNGIQQYPKALIGPMDSNFTNQSATEYQQPSESFLPNLRNLLLENFLFECGIPRYAYLNLGGLETLSLKQTHLHSSDLLSLSPLGNLTHLYVEYNNDIREMPVKLFPFLSNLKHLELDGSFIRTIQENDFMFLHGLQFLSLSSLGISSFHPLAFKPLTDLRTLNITDNWFLGYRNAPLSLTGLDLLENLDMEYCTYYNLSADVFTHVQRLRTLNLKLNNLVDVPSVFNNSPEASVTLFEIECIDISKNNISSLRSHTFSNLKKLKKVELSYNRIQYVADMVFYNLPVIKEIYLKENMIKIIEPGSLISIETLRTLDLRRNCLVTFPTLPGVNTRLGIDNLPENPFSTYLEGNPLLCNCLMFSQLFELDKNNQWVLPNTSEVIWPGAISLANQRFDSLQLYCYTAFRDLQRLETILLVPEDFFDIFPPGTFCSSVCDCYYKCATSWGSAFCNDKNLTEVPKHFNLTLSGLGLANNFITFLSKDDFGDLSSLQIINLGGNYIKQIESGTFYELKNLRALFLDHNNLTTVEDGIFNISSGSLEELYLSFNYISTIEKGAFDINPSIRRLEIDNNNLKSLPDGIFDNLQNLSHLTVSGNPFNCSCDILYLTNWYKENSFETDKQIDTDINDLGCPPFLNQTELFLWVKQKEVICNPPLTFDPITINIPVSDVVYVPSENTLTVLLLCLIIVFILIVLFCGTFCKYRLDILAFIYEKTGRNFFESRFDDDKKTYDAFISFSSLDEDFVLTKLIPNLEGIDNRRKLCIPNRDFNVGESIATNIVNAIENSKTTVIICSNNYLAGEWCSYEFRASHRQALTDRSHRIILIMMEHVDDENLDEDIKDYICNHTYLQRSDTCFWPKLLNSVPVTKNVTKQDEECLLATTTL